MSQPTEQTGRQSSVAFASVTNATSQAINSDDPAWAHCFCPNLTKKHYVQCKYCNKKGSGGITRMKYHLVGIKGKNVSKCEKVPTPVKEEMFALLSKKSFEKEQKAKEKERDIAEIVIDNSDDDCHSEEDTEHGNGVLVLKNKANKRI